MSDFELKNTPWVGKSKTTKSMSEKLSEKITQGTDGNELWYPNKDGETYTIVNPDLYLEIEALEKRVKELGGENTGLKVQMRNQVEAINELTEDNIKLKDQIENLKAMLHL